jgi:hypothetical protein
MGNCRAMRKASAGRARFLTPRVYSRELASVGGASDEGTT